MGFVLQGRKYDLTAQHVAQRVRGHEPDVRPLDRHFVLINGEYWPIKQCLSIATQQERLSFHSRDAFCILKRLGFQIVKQPFSRSNATAN